MSMAFLTGRDTCSSLSSPQHRPARTKGFCSCPVPMGPLAEDRSSQNLSSKLDDHGYFDYQANYKLFISFIISVLLAI